MNVQTNARDLQESLYFFDHNVHSALEAWPTLKSIRYNLEEWTTLECLQIPTKSIHQDP